MPVAQQHRQKVQNNISTPAHHSAAICPLPHLYHGTALHSPGEAQPADAPPPSYVTAPADLRAELARQRDMPWQTYRIATDPAEWGAADRALLAEAALAAAPHSAWIVLQCDGAVVVDADSREVFCYGRAPAQSEMQRFAGRDICLFVKSQGECVDFAEFNGLRIVSLGVQSPQLVNFKPIYTQRLNSLFLLGCGRVEAPRLHGLRSLALVGADLAPFDAADAQRLTHLTLIASMEFKERLFGGMNCIA